MNKFFVFLNAFFNGIDLATTYIFVTKLGPIAEWNPIWAYCIEELGFFWMIVINSSLTTIFLWTLFKVDSKLAWVIVSIQLGLLALWNTFFVFVIST